MRSIILMALLLLAGCGGGKATGPGTETAATQPAPEGETTTKPAVETAEAVECPLFCEWVGTSCKHPDLKAPPYSCGAYSMGQLPDPTLDCPAQCCVEMVSEGGDPDADGIVGTADKCPDAPEDRDGYKDNDGCSDPDNDGDGVEDINDKCCYEAEDKDDFEDLDGCPEQQPTVSK